MRTAVKLVDEDGSVKDDGGFEGLLTAMDTYHYWGKNPTMASSSRCAAMSGSTAAKSAYAAAMSLDKNMK